MSIRVAILTTSGGNVKELDPWDRVLWSRYSQCLVQKDSQCIAGVIPQNPLNFKRHPSAQNLQLSHFSHVITAVT